VHDDEFTHLRSSVKRSPAVRMPQGRHPQVIEAFPPVGAIAEPRRRASFWHIILVALSVTAALVSTSLLAYFLLVDQRSQPYAQLQQQAPDGDRDPPREPQQQVQKTAEDITEQQRPPSAPQQQQQQIQQAQQQSPSPTDLGPRLPMPSDDKLVILITSSLIALNQANATGNYSVFRESAAPGFQRVNPPARLAEVFKNLRDRKLDLSPIILYTPKLFRRPEMNKEGKIRIAGFFPTEPERVNFDLIYQPVQGQ